MTLWHSGVWPWLTLNNVSADCYGLGDALHDVLRQRKHWNVVVHVHQIHDQLTVNTIIIVQGRSQREAKGGHAPNRRLSGFFLLKKKLAGKAKAGIVHSVSGWTRGVQVKLWDPLRTRAIPERLKGVITTRCYTNPRLPLPLPLLGRRACGFSVLWASNMPKCVVGPGGTPLGELPNPHPPRRLWCLDSCSFGAQLLCPSM